MIQAFQPNQPSHRIPFNHGAQKVFDEAAGIGMVPEVEDRYEDMAADFLEKWLVSTSEPLTPEPTPQLESTATTSKKKPETVAQATFEPQMSSFNLSLDWQLSDGRKIS